MSLTSMLHCRLGTHVRESIKKWTNDADLEKQKAEVQHKVSFQPTSGGRHDNRWPEGASFRGAKAGALHSKILPWLPFVMCACQLFLLVASWWYYSIPEGHPACFACWLSR